MKNITHFLIIMFCAAAFAQIPAQKMTVVVGAIGEDPRPGLRKALETQIKIAFVGDGRYTAVTREEAVLAIVDNEHVYQRSGAVDDAQIRQLGIRFGAQYACIVEISPFSNSFTLNAQLIDIENTKIIAMASIPSDLKNRGDFLSASEALVSKLLGRSGGDYGNGVFLDDAQNPSPLSAEIINVLKQKVTVSNGTCLGGVKISVESAPEPQCSDGSLGITCRTDVSLSITQCKNGGRNVLRGVLASTDRNSADNAKRKLIQNIANAHFWSEWVKELEKWTK